MPRYQVGGQISFDVQEVRAKDALDAERKAIKKMWRDGTYYLDISTVRRIVRREGEDVLLEEGE